MGSFALDRLRFAAADGRVPSSASRNHRSWMNTRDMIDLTVPAACDAAITGGFATPLD